MIYDLIVVGGGPAGYLACERAGHAGLKTLLIEKNKLGGVCLNEGCIPTKTLLYSAKLKDGAQHGEKYGIVSGDIYLDHQAVVRRKEKAVKTLAGGIGMALKTAGVEVVNAFATIQGKSAEGYEITDGANLYTGNNVLIATGSVPSIPSIPGLKTGIENGFVLTNKELLNIEEVPKKLVIIGGGVIGMEMASYFNSAGSQVTVVEMLEKIGGSMDEDIAFVLKSNYMKKGITFCLGTRVTEVKSASVDYIKNNEVFTIAADKVLLSIGRRPNTEDVGLEKLGVEIKDYAVLTDEKMETNISGVYAAGDVTGKSMLAHTAYREAEVVVNNILCLNDTMEYTCIPSVIYTNPEAAGVGLTEAEAKEQGLDFTVKKLSMNYSGRYVAENERGDGIIKLIANNKTNRLIGAHMISSYASEVIQSASILIQNGITLEAIKKTIFAHPTIGEIIREAVFQL